MSAEDAALREWIGRSRTASDVVSARLLSHYRATLGEAGEGPGPVPPGLFWCLCPDTAPASDLGGDGHPRLGLFLPPMPLPRRMWAGGALRVHAALQEGQSVERQTTIRDIVFKTGRAGRLAFVTVDHHYRAGGRTVIEERQDIVYREPPGRSAAPARPPEAGPPALEGEETLTVHADETLLFRYSALTFNGHRIHYDAPYARQVEGYDGLVVHGPLQATLLLAAMARRLGGLPAEFSYRGRAPLIAPTDLTVAVGGDGEVLTGHVLAPDGTLTFEASATGTAG